MNQQEIYSFNFSEKEIHLQIEFYNLCIKENIECFLEVSINSNIIKKWIGSIDIVVKIHNKFIGIECKKKSSNDYYHHRNQLQKYNKLNIPIIFFMKKEFIKPIISCLKRQTLMNKIHIYDSEKDMLIIIPE